MNKVHTAFLLILLSLIPASGQLTSMDAPSVDYGEPPVSRVLDEDNYYRSQPESFQRISEAMIRLKRDYDFDAYFVILSGYIGPNTHSMADRYHEAWLGEESDGLVFLIDVHAMKGGNTGHSYKLYGGGLMEKEGVLPRIMLSDLGNLVGEASEAMVSEPTPYLGVEKFAVTVSDLISERLELRRSLDERPETVRLMGVMAIGIVAVSLLVALASKLLGRSYERAAEVYRFPDVLVGERLKAQNGGGKISWTSFGSQS